MFSSILYNPSKRELVCCNDFVIVEQDFDTGRDYLKASFSLLVDACDFAFNESNLFEESRFLVVKVEGIELFDKGFPNLDNLKVFQVFYRGKSLIADVKTEDLA